MQTIETRYIGPTDTKGSRIKATSAGGHSVTIPYNDAASASDCHAAAVRALMEKLDWHGRMIGDHTKRGMVWVWVNDDYVAERIIAEE